MQTKPAVFLTQGLLSVGVNQINTSPCQIPQAHSVFLKGTSLVLQFLHIIFKLRTSAVEMAVGAASFAVSRITSSIASTSTSPSPPLSIPATSQSPLTRHSRRRAGRAMTIISFFTSCITKATSELSERSWACKEDKGCLSNPQAHHGWAKQDRAGQSYYNLVVQRATLRELRKGQWSVRGSRLLIKNHESFRTLHDITECHTPFYLLLHPTSFILLPLQTLT